MNLINAKDLTIGYDDEIVAQHLNFEINEGDYLYIVGENGSGKSTLMKTLLGLTPLLSGTLEINPSLKQNEIGYLPQQTLVQKDFPSSVEEIVMTGFLGKKGFISFYTKKEKQFAYDQMKYLNIYDLRKRSYKELSGGQQQRVLLARALCAANKVLLMDEPVAGLDVNSQEMMYKLIDKLHKENKMTIIMISHDLEAAKKYATSILSFGKKIEFTRKDGK